MSFPPVVRRVTVFVLLAALVPAPGFAWRAPAGTPAATAEGRAFEARAFLDAINAIPQAVASGRPQLYLVYAVDVDVPAAGQPAMTDEETDWFEEFLNGLTTPGPSEVRLAPPPRAPVIAPPTPFCNVPCVSSPQPPPGESILDEIDEMETHIRSLPSAAALAKVNDCITFERNPNESVPVERSMKVALMDALQEAGFDNPDNNGSTEYTRGTGTIVYEGQFEDGDIKVTARLVDGCIVITREFRPLTGSGEPGEPVRIAGTAAATPSTVRATPAPAAAATSNAPSVAGLPPGARAIPSEVARDWGQTFYDTFLKQTGTITGDRDDQGRLLDMNGQVLAPGVQAGLRAAQAGAVRDLNAFAGQLQQTLDGPRDDKVALAKELQTKAAAVRAASNTLATARDTYRSEMARVPQIRKVSSEAAANFEAEQTAALNAAHAAYTRLLSATPALAMKHDGEMLWEALTGDNKPVAAATGAGGAARIAADQRYVETFNAFLKSGMAQAREQSAKVAGMNSLEDLAIFASPAYAGLRERIALMGKPIGSAVTADLMRELEGAGTGALKSWVGDAWTRIIDQGLIVIGVGSIFLPFGPILALGVSAIQVYRSGDRAYVAYGQAADAQGRLGLVGYDAVMTADAKAALAAGEVFADVAFGSLDVLAAVKYAEAVQLARIERAERAASDALDAAIPRGALGAARSVDDPASVLNRIDADALNGRPRVMREGPPGDAAFFRQAGLAPERTVQVGGQTFHLSKPFTGPGGRVAVVAFQETSNGLVIPRTFYLSGEHGVWRAASGFEFNLGKGPSVYVDPRPGREGIVISKEEAEALFPKHGMRTRYINESAVDIAGEMQGVLHRWRAEQPLVQVSSDDAGRAFMGHLEQVEGKPTEFGAFVGADDVVEPLALSRPGTAPDFASGPLDRWTFEHPYYGPSEGFLYRSVDGDTLYIVVRDQKGRVFVPSVQDGAAGVTPFGTRTTAIQTDLTTTPVQHAKGQAGNPVPGTNGDYTDVGNGYRNPLNDAFETHLPPRQASAPAAPLSSATPTVIVPGRQARTGTFGPGGGAATSLGGDEILHVNALADARQVREGNAGGMRAWTGQELERLRTLRNDPSQFRNEYGGRLSQRDLEAIDTLLRHFRIDPATGQRAAAAAGIAIPGAATAITNNSVSQNSPGTADALAQAVLDQRRSGVASQQIVASARTTLAQSGITPQQLAVSLSRRLVASRAPRAVPMQNLGDPAARTPAGLSVGLEALGVSSGEAFTVKAINRSGLPVALRGEGVVVEPVPGARPPVTSARPAQTMAPPATQQVEAFCLERLRPVAAEGMPYRVAPPAVQAQHRGLVSVLHAAKRVADAGRLRPDSEFGGYFNFVRQWAIWSRQEKFDEKQFTMEFMNQTKKNVEGQGMKWTKDMENVVRNAAPGRWQDITAVLDEANTPKTP